MMKKFLLLVILTGVCSNVFGADKDSAPAPIRSRVLGAGPFATPGPSPTPMRQGTGGPFGKKATPTRGRGMKMGRRNRPPMFDFSATKSIEEREEEVRKAASARSTELVLLELEALVKFFDEKELPLSGDHKARTARQVIAETDGDFIKVGEHHMSDKYSYAKEFLNELYDIHGTHVGDERRKATHTRKGRLRKKQQWDPKPDRAIEYERSFLEALAMHGEKKYVIQPLVKKSRRNTPVKAWQDFYSKEEEIPKLEDVLVIEENPDTEGAWGRNMTLEEETALLREMKADIKYNK
jgi:hypothetical protein